MTGEHDDGFASLTTPRNSISKAPNGAGSSIFSSMAAILGLQLEETFFCQICYDDARVAQSHQLSSCGHRFCMACLQSYLAFHIQEGETELTCFFQEARGNDTQVDNTACLLAIPPEEIKQLVDAASYAKWERFRFNKQNANARQCPYCEHSQLCDTSVSTHGTSGAGANECRCISCARVFCFVHGSAHPGESCRSYTNRTHRDEKRNLAVINRLCKPCPGCGQLVEKNGGCNQIKCWACKTSFCWICREVIDEAAFPNHYQWWNVGGCNGTQAHETRADESACERTVLRVTKGILFVLFGPPAVLLAMVCSLLGCCCYPCVNLYNVSYRQAFTSCVCVSGYVLLLPLLVPAAICFLPCVLIAYCASPQSFNAIQSAATPLRDPFSADISRSVTDRDDVVNELSV